jgi:hypothetical protein
MLIVGVLILTFAIAGYGIFLASEAGRLPWQEEPTRIAITPFADIPGFDQPVATPTSFRHRRPTGPFREQTWH